MDGFWLIAGLGNPGRQYNGTRHNIGFEVADVLIDEYHIGSPRHFRKSLAGSGVIGGSKVIVMKPMTYMNLSGEAVREGLDFYKIDPGSRLIVIVDDIALPAGKIRIRARGSAGGHNGLKSIIAHTGSQDFIRVRVGVGEKPSPDADLAGYVLGRPAGEDEKVLEEAKKRAADAVSCIIEQGVDKAMTQYNQ